MRKAIGPILIILALGLPGVGIFAFGVHNLLDLRRFHAHARPVTGKVIDFKQIGTTEDGGIYSLAVAYPAPNGALRNVRVKTEKWDYAIGQPVAVLHTDDPQPEGRVAGVNTTWGTPVIMTVAGLAWSAFAAFMMAIAVRVR